MDAAEYKHVVLSLIFVKYISNTFQTLSNELTERFADPEDEYYIQDADTAGIVSELEDRGYYREVNVFWVLEAARWENLRAQAKQPDIGKRIDDALTLIETENHKLKGILDKRYAVHQGIYQSHADEAAAGCHRRGAPPDKENAHLQQQARPGTGKMGRVTEGVGDQFHRAVYRAFFDDGVNIALVDELL